MLKIKNLEYITDTTVRFILLVEDNENLAFQMTVDVSKEYSSVVKSEVPDDYKIYERQACVALDNCKEKPFPKEICSMWY